MNKVLITGTSGFLSKNLMTRLNSSELVCENLSLRGSWKFTSLNQYNTIIHLAGKAHDLKNTNQREEYFTVNTDLTKRLFDIFLDSHVGDFIFMSSVKAVADIVEGELNEEMVPQPNTPYGESKLKAEEYILNQTLPRGKRVFVLRPCMVHGPGNKGNLNLLYKIVKSGIPYPLGGFNNSRSFLSIENLSFVINAILNNLDIPGGIYNLADDEPLATTELIKIIGEGINKKAKIWHFSPYMIKSIAKIGDVLHLPLNSERLKKLTENYVVSNAKIKKELEITSLPVSARQGMLYTIKSFESK